MGDSGALDQAWGTEVTSDDTGGTTDDLFFGPEVELTVGNSPAGEKMVFFRITRVVGDANDTLDIDAGLVEVRMHYNVNIGNDS